MSLHRKTFVLLLLAAVPISSFATDATNGGVIMSNPLNLNYLFEERDPVHRTAADPVIVLYHDTYFLFSSHAAGYSYSDNLRDWTHVFSKMPLVKEWAPAVMVYDDYIYYMGFGNKRVFRTKDPIGDVWEEVGGTQLPDKGDPDFFVDDDGRTYYLWGCSAGGPMQGQEFDPATFKPLTEVFDLMPANGSRFGWEVPGNRNEKVGDRGWNEGVSMVHDGDWYYFFYATPGTEYTTYCSGAYVGKSPLGPFEPMVGSPYAIRPSGFFTGGGHGHPFRDRYGNHWYVASLIIGTREHYERRIGIFPAYYSDGYAHAITDGFDKPFVVPNRKVDFERESILADMQLLGIGKTMTASSTKGDMTPNNASDDDIRTWWSAKSGNSGEWLKMDLGRVMNVEAIQVCFADEGFKNYRFDDNIPTYQYVVEGSKDGKTWHSVIDRSDNTKDQIYELLIPTKNERIRYLRVVNKADIPVGQFSVSDMRVFGHAKGKTPSAVKDFKAVRQADRRRIAMTWQPQPDAVGYIVRWGAARDRIDHASRVFTTSVDYGFFDSEQTYYVTVQPFNDAGLGKSSEVVEVNPESIAQNVCGSLVPTVPSTAPDYYCTWNLQGYVTSYGTGAGSNDLRLEINEDNLFGERLGYKAWGKRKPKRILSSSTPRREITWTVEPHYQGWLGHYPMLHGDLTFVMDDSWDIPRGPGDDGASKRPYGRNYDNPYLATMTVDATRFPSFQGDDQGRMARLTDAVKQLGWRSLGGWVCAQDPIGLTQEYTGLQNTYENSLRWTAEQEERFWKRRLKESEQAGFSYWKVDWGNKDRNEPFRRRLSQWAMEVAPHVTIEHASFQDGGTHHPDFISFSPVIRSYDVNNQIAQAQTLQRLHDLGRQPDAEHEGWGIINCEDEPYIAAGLGCAIGVMRHPYVGSLPNGEPDSYFADLGPQSRRLKNRLNEVVRAVRWHRIALPFGHRRDQWLGDTVMLAESGGGRTWEAPARMSRRLPLPEITGKDASSPLRPYVLASCYDNGCSAIAIINRNIEGCYQQQRMDVRLQLPHWDSKLGVFGYCRSLTICYQDGLPAGPFTIYAQDLATDESPKAIPYTVTPDGRGIVLQGSDLEALCKGHDYPYTEVEREPGKDYTDLSDPGVVIKMKNEK